MQIRQLGLDELDSAYDVVRELRPALGYEEFEELIYAMRHQEYRMYGIFEGATLATFAGVSVRVSLEHRRHLLIEDFVTRSEFRRRGYGREMLRYLGDTARIFRCEQLLLSSELHNGSGGRTFLENEGFEKRATAFLKPL